MLFLKSSSAIGEVGWTGGADCLVMCSSSSSLEADRQRSSDASREQAQALGVTPVTPALQTCITFYLATSRPNGKNHKLSMSDSRMNMTDRLSSNNPRCKAAIGTNSQIALTYLHPWRTYRHVHKLRTTSILMASLLSD